MDATATPLSLDSLIALIFLGVIALASLITGFFWLAGKLGWLDDPTPALAASVKRSSPTAPARYGNQIPAPLAERAAFRASRPEVEAEATAEVRRKLDPEASVGFVTMTEKALQKRDAEQREAGMVAMFAIFERRGLIPSRKASELKEIAFGVSSGRRLQRLNAAIDAVAAKVEAPPPEPAPAAPLPERTPLVGRAVPAGVQFAEE